MIYLKITNAGAAGLLALTFMGCALYLLKGESNPLFDFNGAFGMIFGVGLAYLVKGMTVGGVISVSKVFNLDIFESGIAAQIAKSHANTLNKYVDEKFLISIFWSYLIFFVVRDFHNAGHFHDAHFRILLWKTRITWIYARPHFCYLLFNDLLRGQGRSHEEQQVLQ